VRSICTGWCSSLRVPGRCDSRRAAARIVDPLHAKPQMVARAEEDLPALGLRGPHIERTCEASTRSSVARFTSEPVSFMSITSAVPLPLARGRRTA
jgi:hypothetical protein